MFWIIKQVFIVLLGFGSSLTTNCLSLSNEPGMARLNPIELNHVQINSYQLMISLAKCNRSCNAVDNLIYKNMQFK